MGYLSPVRYLSRKGLYPGGLCPGESLSRGGLCPGGLPDRESLDRDSPVRWRAGGRHPTGMLSCYRRYLWQPTFHNIKIDKILMKHFVKVEKCPFIFHVWINSKVKLPHCNTLVSGNACMAAHTNHFHLIHLIFLCPCITTQNQWILLYSVFLHFFLTIPSPEAELSYFSAPITDFLWFLFLINTLSPVVSLFDGNWFLHTQRIQIIPQIKRIINGINAWWLNLTAMHNEEQSNLGCTDPRQMRINSRTVWQSVFYRRFCRCVIKPHRSHRVTPHGSN